MAGVVQLFTHEGNGRTRAEVSGRGGQLGSYDADAAVRAHLSTSDLERLLDPRNYTGSAGTFVDRVLSALPGRDK